MALFDLLGRSWALGIMWRLSDGPATFRQIQERCENLSPTVLNKRIKELRASGFLEHTNSGYQLTQNGLELFELLKPLGGYANKWAIDLQQHSEGN